MILNLDYKREKRKIGKRFVSVNLSLVTCDSKFHIGSRERLIYRENAIKGIGINCCKKCALKVRPNAKTRKDYELLADSLNIKFLGPMPETTEHKTYWECVCGNVFERTYHSVSNQESKNCQECALIVPALKNFGGYKEIPLGYWNIIKEAALKRNIVFDLNIEWVYDLFLKHGRKCAISGNDIDFGFPGGKKRVKFSASLDRIDSSKGYTIDNVQWVHKDINWMKQDFEEKYFIQLCKNIANHQRKTWLITGALGYVGFEVCRLLKNSTDKVIAIDIIKVEERERQLNDWGIEFVRCDLFSLNMSNNIDYCIHCAGITDVPMTLSQSTPEKDREIIRVGTEGTRELIRFLPKQCKLAFLSTHVVYEGCINKTININETTEPEPILAYSRSKRQSELDLLNSCRDFLILRLGSVYGLPATRWKIVANLFSKMTAKEKKIKIFGGECLKPLVGIKDVAKAITGLIQSNYNREIFHIVNENIKIKDIATICKKYQNDLVIENVDIKSPNNGYSLSNEKLLATGFRFEQSLDIEISKMIHAWRNDLIN